MGFWGDIWEHITDAATDTYDGIRDVFTSGEKEPSAMRSPIENLNLLDEMIRQHGLHFARLLRESPTDLLRTFVVSRWEPFERGFALHFVRQVTPSGQMGPLGTPEDIASLAKSAAQGLSELRDLARANYIDVPDLDTIARAYAAYTAGVQAGTMQPAVSGDLTIKHDRQGRVIIEHEVGGCHSGVSVGHRFGGGRGWGGGRGVYGGRGYGWGGWGPSYVVEAPYYAVPPGCYLDAYGNVICPPAPQQPPGPGDEQPVMSGWFDDVTNTISNTVSSAVNGVTHTISSAAGTVGSTLKQLKGPIEMAAATAAGAAAAGIPGVGPVVAPMASGLARSLVDAAAGSGNVQQAAKKVVAQAATAAQTDPHVRAAFQTAQRAVAHSTIAYHAVDQTARAAAGDTAAAARLAELANSAAAGDPDAQAALAQGQAAVQTADASNAFSAQNDPYNIRRADWQVDDSAIDIDPTTVSGATPPNISDPRAQARAAAAQYPANVVGVVLRSDGSWGLESFASSDDADDWYGSWLNLPHAYLYVGYFDKAYGSGAQNETVAPALLAKLRGGGNTAVSGVFAPLLAGLAGFAAGHWGPAGIEYAKLKWQEHKAKAQAKAA